MSKITGLKNSLLDRKRIKGLFINLGLTLVSLLIFMALFEVFLRVTDVTIGTVPRCEYTSAELVPYKNAPDINEIYAIPEYEVRYVTNSLGFRDSELADNPNYRIVGVGDSMTFGSGVGNDETYLNVAESEIGNGIEIINAGVGGFNSKDCLNILKEIEGDFDYDMIIFALFLDNDIIQNLTDNDRIVDESTKCLYPPKKKQYTFREFLYQNFYVVRFFSKARQIPAINQLVIDIGLGSKGENNPRFNLLRKEKDAASLDAIEKTEAVLRDVKEYALVNEKDLIVILIPSKYQIHDELFLEEVEKYLANPDEVNNLEMNEVLTAFLESNDIDYFDPTSTLREYAANNDSIMLYYEKDSHWTPLGQEIAGKALAQKLVQSQYLPFD